jgi:uncharacterized RDD family membrane protein YckC
MSIAPPFLSRSTGTVAVRRDKNGLAMAVVTPEAVPLDFQVAGIGSRFLALIADWAIQGTILFGVVFAAGVAAAALGGGLGGGLAAAAVYLLVFLVVFGYPVAFETLWRGRSPGKAALGLRVVTREGGPIRFHHAAVRAALGIVDFLATGGAAAVLSVLLTRDSQRLGDLVAGTLVLRERTGMGAPAAIAFPVPPGLESYAATIDVAGITPDDYSAVRGFLLRAPSLPAPVRSGLALELARPLAIRLRTSPPPGVGPELFLLCLAGAVQRRHQPPPAPAAQPVAVPPLSGPEGRPVDAEGPGFAPPT